MSKHSSLELDIPTCYIEGYKKGRRFDLERSTNYIKHTTIGDPIADRLIADLVPFSQRDVAQILRLTMSGKMDEIEVNVPDSLHEFMESAYAIPDWLDLSTLNPGCRLFYRDPELVIVGMVAGVLIEGFATNISKAFFLTGRLRDKGLRRLKQNNRHMLDIFTPGGMQIYGDGWIHSVRIRLVHAKIRHLLSQSDEWDLEELGTPISAAHLGFAIASFSAQLLIKLKKLGASFSVEESESFLTIWRYSGYLMGIPESILYQDEEDALKIFAVGRICEPPIALECIALSASLIQSAPLFIGHTDRKQRQKTASYVAKVCRALIGDELADELRILPDNGLGILWRFRMARQFEKLLYMINPMLPIESKKLTTMINFAMFDKDGISFKLPDHQYGEESSDW